MDHVLLLLYALLLIGVFTAWGSCLFGAAALPAWLLLVATRARRARQEESHRVPSEPPTVIIVVLVVYAVVMAACAAFFLASAWYRPDLATSKSTVTALKWAALPAWSSLAASASVTVLWRRRRYWRAIRSEDHG